MSTQGTTQPGIAKRLLASWLHTPSLSADAKKFFWRSYYSMVSRRQDGLETMLLNYGYAADDADGQPVDGTDRFGLALYEAVAGAVDLAGKDVLEIGCGRGGGAAHLFERFAPRSLTGVDLASNAIARCRASYARPGLHFATGDAEDLPYPAEMFDAVVSVESSHCYPDVPRFLTEVHRVLRPDGVLLLTDFRRADGALIDGRNARDEDVGTLHGQIEQAGFRVVEEEDITPKVVRALTLCTPALRDRVARRVPGPLQKYALEFSGVQGSSVYRSFDEGRATYLRFVLAKA